MSTSKQAATDVLCISSFHFPSKENALVHYQKLFICIYNVRLCLTTLLFFVVYKYVCINISMHRASFITAWYLHARPSNKWLKAMSCGLPHAGSSSSSSSSRILTIRKKWNVGVVTLEVSGSSGWRHVFTKRGPLQE